MKKIMMMAMMVVASATAFAGDSDALLVDLAYDAFNKQSTIMTENQAMKQIGGTEKPVDEALMTESAYNAIMMALECDKYDQQPNEKGKVAPKFAAKNAQRLWVARNTFINAGQAAAQQHDDAGIIKYWGTFVDTFNNPFFAAERSAFDKLDENVKKDQLNLLGQVAYFAGSHSQKTGLVAKAREYYEIAADNQFVDEEIRNAAHNSVLTLMREGLKDKADTLRVLEEYKQMYSQKPDDDLLMNAIYVMYSELKDKDSMRSLLDARLEKDPNNYMALANKGLMAMEDNNADEAINYLSKAVDIQPENSVVRMYLGICYNAKASTTSETDPAKAKEIFKLAIDQFDKCKELDPDMMQSRWGYNRYQAYYNYYGEDAPETKQAEADSK